MVAIAGSSEWLAVTFTGDAVVRGLSPNAEQITGYSAPEIVGRPLTQILADRSVFEVQQMMLAAREWGIWEGEIIHRDRGGRTFNARGFVSTLSGRGGPDDGFLLISTLPQILPEGGTNEQLHEVGTRLRSITHQLNNPLAVIMGFTQLILIELPPEGKVRADVERLY